MELTLIIKNFEFQTNNLSIFLEIKIRAQATQEIQYIVISLLREKRDNCFIDHKIEL